MTDAGAPGAQAVAAAEPAAGFRLGWLLRPSPRAKAVWNGLAQWAGEAAIGLIPLIVYMLTHRFSRLPITAACPSQPIPTPPTALGGCMALSESAAQEICILAVVISGLALLSTTSIGQAKRQVTMFTRFLVLIALFALIFGSILYAFFTAHLDRDAEAVTYMVLAVALLSSLFLAIEGAILKA